MIGTVFVTISTIQYILLLTGHMKGVAHYLMGDKEKGQKSMESATKTTAVVGAGVLTVKNHRSTGTASLKPCCWYITECQVWAQMLKEVIYDYTWGYGQKPLDNPLFMSSIFSYSSVDPILSNR